MIFITNGQGWPSEYTRGIQIAQILGCNVNTKLTSFDETTILVKTRIAPEQATKMSNLYLDYIDDTLWIEVAARYPNAKLIALTDLHKQTLEAKVKNEIVVIPEHTCNFEKAVRTRKKVTTVGYVGSPQCFDIDPDVLGKLLNSVGLKFSFLACQGKETTRKDVANFYKSIDIQVAFRLPNRAIRNPLYRNPLKVFNAGSFKIPTVAYPEISYSLCAGSYFLEAVDLASVVDKCWRLAHDKELYDFYANRVYEWSKQFDIEHVARLYAKLAPNEKLKLDRRRLLKAS